jgi:hypothetical protein
MNAIGGRLCRGGERMMLTATERDRRAIAKGKKKARHWVPGLKSLGEDA